jgi:prepilin-type N-terminal cleavage/methylation domain-containing protein
MIRRGFTLLEMVLVILIMGIVFALAVPAMGGLGSDPEEGESWKELVDLMRSSRILALENAVTVRMVLDPETGLYSVDSVGPRGAGLVQEGKLLVGLNMSMYADSARVKFTFRPDGSAFSDSLIVRSSGYATKLSVEPFTGRVLIEDR